MDMQMRVTSGEEMMRERASGLLRRHYGYSGFRPGQWDVMWSIMQGRDCVVLMPTGGGKSLCFQLPALMGEGCCVVVSPLIALMHDQVTALQANGIAAAAVNSLNDEGANRETYARAMRGELKLLYISPERLLQDLDSIFRHIKVSFVAVDEAHCISQWGHDFRPVYTQLTRIKEQWPDVPVMALTATADRLTRDDIARALGLSEPYCHIGSFDRPNLSLTVVTGADKRQRVDTVRALVARYPQDCGIVYCLSRKKTEDMAKALADAGVRVGCYHAGMDSAARAATQRDFVDGRLQVICATIAFGMGIDKSNIRWVVHNNLPGNIESYYQEIGRAGRDGLPAETILFYSFGDVLTRRSFVEESGQREINSSKLDLMQQYAEASVCRRRILLSYFSEEMDHDCGNCDNCRNPRMRIDGTVLAQKALSAIVRVKGAEGMNVIIEILRGMSPAHVVARGYHLLPTYGVGRDLSVDAWSAYILQMVQLGLVEIAYEEHFHLRPTPLGMKVLRGGTRIELAQYVPRYYGPRGEARHRPMAAPAAPRLTPEQQLLVDLKVARAGLADRYSLADYMVVSDVAIDAMVRLKPDTIRALADTEGVGVVKAVRYHNTFLPLLRKARGLSRRLPPGTSDEATVMMLESGMNLGEVAEARGLKMSTLFGHVTTVYGTEDLERLRGVVSDDVRAKAGEWLGALTELDDRRRAIRESDPARYQTLSGEYNALRDDVGRRFSEATGLNDGWLDILLRLRILEGAET